MPARSEQEIRDWIVARVRRHLGDDEPIDFHEPIVGYGLDSMHVVALAADLEDWLGIRFGENPLVDHPTIDALAKHLAARSTDTCAAESDAR